MICTLSNAHWQRVSKHILPYCNRTDIIDSGRELEAEEEDGELPEQVDPRKQRQTNSVYFILKRKTKHAVKNMSPTTGITNCQIRRLTFKREHITFGFSLTLRLS